MYTEVDRVKLRKYLGFPSVWNTNIESIITRSSSIADGGNKTDSSTETEVKSLLAKIDLLENKIFNELIDQVSVTSANNKQVELSGAFGINYLRNMQRQIVQQVCILLGLNGPGTDAFSASEPTGDVSINRGYPIE